MGHGTDEEFEGKRFKDAARGDLELGGLAEQAERDRIDDERKESKALLKRFKDALGERVTEVRVSERLRESPACLVRGEADLSAQMRRVLAASGPDGPAGRKPVLELNVTHPLVRYLDALHGRASISGARAAALRSGRARRTRARSPIRPISAGA